MSTFYPQEPEKNNPDQSHHLIPPNPYENTPTLASSPYGQPPSHSSPYGGPPAQNTPVPPPQYQRYPPNATPPPATNPNINYANYMRPGNYGSPPPVPRPPSRTRPFVIGILVLIIIGSIAAIAIPYEKTQVDNTNATATVSTQQTGVARDATGTVVTQNGHITATAQANAQATASVVAANPNPYKNKGTLVLMEKTPIIEMGECQTINGALHLTNSQQETADYCWGGASYADFAYDIELTIVKGDCGGIIFREDGTEGNKEYMFNICQDGKYSVDIDQGAALQFKNLLYGTRTSGMHQGLNRTNLVGVVAQGSSFSLYVNKQLVTTFTDSTYGSGQIGVDALDNGNATDVTFANQRLWKF
jgi:type II secretory pathway pseudopilin PulG